MSLLLQTRHSVLPGFHLALGFTILYLSLIMLIPLAGLFLKTATLSWEQFWQTVTAPRVLASYRLSFGASFIGAAINAVFGLLIAWVLARYRFPGKRLVDALVDLPFALPTAVAGITLAAIYSEKGWIGQYLADFGFKVAYTPLGIVVALTFIGLPFVVRTVQPVLRRYGTRARGGRRMPWGQPLADLPLRDPAECVAGPIDRLFARACPRHRRVRLGDLHRWQYPHGLGDHAAPYHHQTRAVRLCRRYSHRHSHARCLVYPVADHQPAAALG
jgi:hypothetical protein